MIPNSNCEWWTWRNLQKISALLFIIVIAYRASKVMEPGYLIHISKEQLYKPNKLKADYRQLEMSLFLIISFKILTLLDLHDTLYDVKFLHNLSIWRVCIVTTIKIYDEKSSLLPNASINHYWITEKVYKLQAKNIRNISYRFHKCSKVVELNVQKAA